MGIEALDLGGTGAKKYEDLIKIMLDVFSYSIIKNNYNHNMDEAASYVGKILESDPKQRYSQYSDFLKKIIKRFNECGVSCYTDLLSKIDTKEKAELFVQKAHISNKDLLVFLNYLRNWVLPKKILLTEFGEKENRNEMGFIKKLNEKNIKSNLDLFELGQTKAKRRKILQQTGVPEEFLIKLLAKIDFNRTPYCRAKCANHYYNMGFRTLEQLANTSQEETKRMFTEYQERIKRNMKSAMDPYHGSIIAKALPKIIEY